MPLKELADHMIKNRCVANLWDQTLGKFFKVGRVHSTEVNVSDKPDSIRYDGKLFVLKTERDDVKGLWFFHVTVVGDRTVAEGYVVEITIFSLDFGQAGKQSVRSVLIVDPYSEAAETGNCCIVPYTVMRRITAENKWNRNRKMAASQDFGVMVSVARV